MRKDRAANFIFPVVTAILLAAFEILLFYFLEASWLVVLIAVVCDIIFTRLITDKTFTYMSGFAFILTTGLISGAFVVCTKLGFLAPFFEYKWIFGLIIIVHYIVVFFVCTISYLTDRGSKILHYNDYFIASSVFMWLSLIALFAYKYVLCGEVFPGKVQYSIFIPVVNYAASVSECIEGNMQVSELLFYSLCYIGFFVPVGFYVHLATGKRMFVLRLILFLLLPAAVEGAQYLLFPAGAIMEDVVLALIGELLGSAIYAIFNRVCENVHDEEFLKKKDRMSFYH